MGNIDITVILVGLITLCGNMVTGLLTLIGTVVITASQRNKLHAETLDKLSEADQRKAQTAIELQDGMSRLNAELEQRMTALRKEVLDLQEDLRGLREEKRILEERLLDVQRKYEAILQEYQRLISKHALTEEENFKLKRELDEQRKLLEELKTSVHLQSAQASA